MHQSPINTELASCNLCGEKEHRLLFPDKVLSISGRKGIVRCSNCGLVYSNIRLAETELFESYASKQYPDPSTDWTEGRKRAFLPYMEMLSQFRKTNTILDVGAGHGFFLAACKDEGWNCQGIEPSKQCRDFAGRKFNIHLSENTIESAGFEKESFDVITLWNVLSHLTNPQKTLANIFSLLRPGGAVVIRSPNAAFHVPAKKIFIILERILPPLNPTVFHLYSFDNHTMSRMLDMVGFIDIQVTPASLGWTTTPDASSGRLKRGISCLAEKISTGIFILTKKRSLFSPSMLSVGIKHGRKTRE